MFEKSQLWERYGGGYRKSVDLHFGPVAWVEPEDRRDRRVWSAAVLAALALHVALFLVHFPATEAKVYDLGPQEPVYVVKPVRFQPPPPSASPEIPEPKEKRRIIPIPDPTPDEPEPIRDLEIEIPDLEIVGTAENAVFGIPDGPPRRGLTGYGAVRLTGDIQPPVKTFYPTPTYTEDGRKARIQGVVILEAVIDARGDVAAVRVLKGLPHGLTESAVETAKLWKFQPARRAGQPVAVFLNLTIRFSLQ